MDAENKKMRYFIILLSMAVVFYILARFGNIIWSAVLPFAAAIFFAGVLRYPSEYISKKLKIPGGVSCAFTVLSFYAVLFTTMYLVVSKLASELLEFLHLLPSFTESIPSAIEGLKNTIGEFIPFFDIDETAELLKTALSSIGIAITEKITFFVSSAVVSVPKLMITFFVTVVATCYFTKDFCVIKRFVLCQLPEKQRGVITECKRQLFDITGKYIGAYLTIALITFAELFAGLMFIRREYAFLLAILITAVDILPIFGSGAVLLPWAFAEYVMKNPTDGTKLLFLYVVVCTVRQIIEPKIIGDFIGLYPLTALFCVFSGGIIMGVPGIFIFPVCAIIIKNLNEKGLLKLYKTPPEDTKEKIFSARAKYKKFRKS